LGHGLDLKRIHPTHPADRLLVKLHRSALIRRVLIPGADLPFEFAQGIPEFIESFRIHVWKFLLRPSISITEHRATMRKRRIGERPMTSDSKLKPDLKAIDPVWDQVRREAEALAAQEPFMASLAHSVVLHHDTLEHALSYRLAQKLSSPEMSPLLLREMADHAYAADRTMGAAARADIVAVFDRDPACNRMLQPLLYFKGFLAIQSYRLAHHLWTNGRKDLALFVQMRSSEIFGVDIHPGARVGQGIMIDHAHSIVIGETAVVGDDVSMLHSVTLGGTGKAGGDRHPKIGDGVLIGAGAKVLGNIKVGNCARIAAGSVVLQDVPPCKTVAGVPARIVGDAGCDRPSHAMDHRVAEGSAQE
jgi:serine O-acetyltransferase